MKRYATRKPPKSPGPRCGIGLVLNTANNAMKLPEITASGSILAAKIIGNAGEGTT